MVKVINMAPCRLLNTFTMRVNKNLESRPLECGRAPSVVHNLLGSSRVGGAFFFCECVTYVCGC